MTTPANPVPPATDPKAAAPAAPVAPVVPAEKKKPASALELPPEQTPAEKEAAAKAKTEADAKAAEEAKAKGEPAKTPETVAGKEIELKIPEGLTVDQAAIAAFKADAKDLKIDPAAAQRIFDTFVKTEQARVAADDAAFEKQDAAWAAQVKSDPNLGDAGIAAARRALSTIEGGRALADLIHRAGLGNHPVVLTAFAALGKTMKEDSVAGTPPSAAKPALTFEQLAYPTMFPKP